MRVLVVDDEESLALLLKRTLELDGYQVSTAHNGLEALKLLREQPFDLVITDYMMPDMDGLEMIRQMKSDDNLRHVKVIMLTVSDFKDTLDEALALGVDDFVTKPFDFQEILSVVSWVLRGRRERS